MTKEDIKNLLDIIPYADDEKKMRIASKVHDVFVDITANVIKNYIHEGNSLADIFDMFYRMAKNRLAPKYTDDLLTTQWYADYNTLDSEPKILPSIIKNYLMTDERFSSLLHSEQDDRHINWVIENTKTIENF